MMKRSPRSKSASRNDDFEWGSWSPRSHGKDAGSFKRSGRVRKPRAKKAKKRLELREAMRPDSQATLETASVVSEEDEEEVDLFATDMPIDDFTFDSILGLGEQPTGSQLVAPVPPSPGTLAAFPCLAPSPPKNEGTVHASWIKVSSPPSNITMRKDGGVHFEMKAPRTLPPTAKKLRGFLCKKSFFDYTGSSVSSSFNAINKMINTPPKPPAVRTANKLVGTIYNAHLVRAM